ncbi:putative GABA permease [Polyplosphaeria fusca]|uniref:GABA permease n=1 Tax=Polyplosphaeria fusca TaxID=682080 RepID=A0A9P4QPI2_9PLEO|nr:putative GABA permease [Polyplosphaeria fusca]
MAKDRVPVQVFEDTAHTPEVKEKWKGTDVDRHDMLVIGRPQQLRRNFHLVSILGFGATLICTWEINAATFVFALTNGGTAGLIYGFIIATIGYGFVYASLAEMASMSPTAGGQYHWVSEFSPRSCQKYLSYLSGWLCFTGWQAAIGSIAFLVGGSIQGLIVLHHPDTYVFERWHTTLLVFATILGAYVFNTVLAKKLPLVEGLVLLIHVCGLFAVTIPLWALSPRKSSHAVFTEFTNNGGWPTMGLSFMVGLLPVSGSLAGIDCVVHMAEEVKDASRVLPRSLMISLPLNAALGFIMIVTMCYCTIDVDAVLESDVGVAGYPYIQIFYEATKSKAAATIMTILPLISLTGSVTAEIATASRQLWSFSRDGGVPFSRYISAVNMRWAIPLNALLISLVINMLLPLINIGSTAAINAIFSLSGVSILTSYIICIGSLLVKRLRGEELPPHRWTLGRWGTLINSAALVFLFPLAIFQFFPPIIPITAAGMNYGSLMWGTMIIFSTGYYFLYGRKQYTPPVYRVRRDL